MKTAPLTLLVLILLGVLPSCRQGSSRTATRTGPSGPPVKTDTQRMDGEDTPALVARLRGDDPKAPLARDALLARWQRLDSAQKAKVAEAVLAWTMGDPALRAGTGSTSLVRILETMAPSASAATLAAFAQKHAAVLLAQDSGEPGDALAPARLEPYGPHFRKAVLSAALQVFDVTLPVARQQRVLALITGCAQGPDRKSAGDVILKNLQVKEKISLESVRALGELQTDGATEYLRLFIQMDVPVTLRQVAIEAISALIDDPAATDVLYDLTKPAFFSLLSGDALEPALLERARWAIKGLGRTRACSLAAKEYVLLRKVYRQKPAAAVAPLREEVLRSLVRLMWCADPKKTRADVPAADRKSAGLE